MHLRKFVYAAAAALVMANPALAQGGGDGPSTVPNGPYGDNDSLASLRSYDQLIAALESSVHASKGTATLHYAPYTSNTGRDVPYVVIGNGPTAALIIAQQHGDEMETSDSAVNFIRTLTNSSQGSMAIREALTVVVVPRVNVDGFDGENPDGTPITNATGTQVPPWRENWDPRFTVNPLPAFYARGRGYDINRYHAFRPECPFDNPNYPNLTTGVVSCETLDFDSKRPVRPHAGEPGPRSEEHSVAERPVQAGGRSRHASSGNACPQRRHGHRLDVVSDGDGDGDTAPRGRPGRRQPVHRRADDGQARGGHHRADARAVPVRRLEPISGRNGAGDLAQCVRAPRRRLGPARTARRHRHEIGRLHPEDRLSRIDGHRRGARQGRDALGVRPGTGRHPRHSGQWRSDRTRATRAKRSSTATWRIRWTTWTTTTWAISHLLAALPHRPPAGSRPSVVAAQAEDDRRFNRASRLWWGQVGWVKRRFSVATAARRAVVVLWRGR